MIAHIANENMAANSEDQDVKADRYIILSIMCVHEQNCIRSWGGTLHWDGSGTDHWCTAHTV